MGVFRANRTVCTSYVYVIFFKVTRILDICTVNFFSVTHTRFVYRINFTKSLPYSLHLRTKNFKASYPRYVYAIILKVKRTHNVYAINVKVIFILYVYTSIFIREDQIRDVYALKFNSENKIYC